MHCLLCCKFLSGGGVIAQEVNPCGNFCNLDLSNPLPITFATDELTYCKPGTSWDCTLDDPNHTLFSTINVPYFDVHYKQNYCDKKNGSDRYDACTANECVLKIHVYYPTNHDYASCPLPAVILFHGGAYNECGDYDDRGIVLIAQGFAERGFVVFNVNYRVGVITDNRLVNNSSEGNQALTYVSAQQILAIYRAVQDARGAIRSIIKMNSDGTFLNTNGQHPYKIDATKVFVGGVSAGSLIAMAACLFGDDATAYNKFDQVCPGVQTAMSTPSPNLGTLDPPIYYANRAEVNFHTNVIGILNCWGSLFVPTTYLSHPYDFYKGQGFTIPPIISFCGKNDPVFWYTHQGVYFSPSTTGSLQRNNETRCVPQTGGYSVTALTDGFGHPIPNAYSIGSQDIYQMLLTPGGTNTPQTTEFYLDCQMYHGLDKCDCDPLNYNKDANNNNSCTISCNYQSDFGTGYTNQEDTYNYIVGRAATFFQTIQGGYTSYITETKFVECVNNRIKCKGIANSGCDQQAVCPTE